METRKKISVIGLGYVGLVTAGCLSEQGHDVLCYDIDGLKRSAISCKKLCFYEPDLCELIIKEVDRNGLRVVNEIEEALISANVIFIAVGTPENTQGKPIVNQIESILRKLMQVCNAQKTVIIKSTVTIGFADEFNALISQHGLPITIVSNPEFLQEGKAIENFINPDRVIVGTDNQNSYDLVKNIYQSFVPSSRIIQVSNVEAEFIKYASNAMLALRVSFINELAEIATKLELNFLNIERGVGLDKRIGGEYLRSGIGYGGSCLSKDLNALLYFAKTQQVKADLCEQIKKRNQVQRNKLFNKAMQYYDGSIKNKCFSLWGLSFKANTSDMRDAPSIDLIKQLVDAGAEIKAYDPKADLIGTLEYANVKQCQSIEESLCEVDALFICTEWSEFIDYPFSALVNKLHDRVIFDGRNIFVEKALKYKECAYFGIGIEFDLSR